MSRQKIESMFRPKYRELSHQEKAQCDRIKSAATNLAIELLPADTREKKLALTKLEESVMWAIKGVTA